MDVRNPGGGTQGDLKNRACEQELDALVGVPMNASVKVPVDALLGVPVGASVGVPVDALVGATLDTQPIDNSNPEALYTASNSAGPQTAPQSPRMELKGGGRYLPETRIGPGANRTKTEDWYHWGVDGLDLSSIYADQADNYLSVVNPYNQLANSVPPKTSRPIACLLSADQ